MMEETIYLDSFEKKLIMNKYGDFVPYLNLEKVHTHVFVRNKYNKSLDRKFPVWTFRKISVNGSPSMLRVKTSIVEIMSCIECIINRKEMEKTKIKTKYSQYMIDFKEGLYGC